jgi:hypothetical protein
VLVRELAVTEYRAEDVVEVVGDSSGECPHRFHFLRLPKLHLEPVFLALGFLAGCYVDRGAHESVRLAGTVPQSTSASKQPMPLAVRMTHAILELEERRSSVDMLVDKCVEPREIVGMHIRAREHVRARRHGRLRPQPGKDLHFGRDEYAVALEIPIPMSLVRALHRECVPLLALAQGRLSGLLAPQLVEECGDGDEEHEDPHARPDAE